MMEVLLQLHELYFSYNSACEHISASRCPSCNSAVDVLVDAFTTSVQVFLGGEGNEPILPPHRRFHGHSNLLKGFSKVSILKQYMYMYMYIGEVPLYSCIVTRSVHAVSK